MDKHSPKDPDKISAMASDPETVALASKLFLKSCEYNYSYNFSWLGRPVIQYPADIIALQEIIWSVQPDLIIETGVAHGGSAVFFASMLELIGKQGVVVGVDIEIRSHNREAIEQHPLARRIELVEGSSVDPITIDAVRALAEGRARVLVVLDSNHTHEHVLQELHAYSPFVKRGSYLVVLDTVVNNMPKSCFPNRPWGPDDNPWTAVQAFLQESDRFEIDREMSQKLLLTVAPDGYLRCVKDAD